MHAMPAQVAVPIYFCPQARRAIKCAQAAITKGAVSAVVLLTCRNINHEVQDAFMCIECGHSRFGSFELSVSASPCVSYPAVQSQDDAMRATAFLVQQTGNAFNKRSTLSNAVK